LKNKKLKIIHKIKIMTREFTYEELAQFDGKNPDLPIYVALTGVIYDVSESRDLYKEGKGYHIFAGKDASQVNEKQRHKIGVCKEFHESGAL
jgi:predicted heme/steroid binding protein